MQTKSPVLIYFSPTGTTEKILRAIAASISPEEPRCIDAARPETREKDFTLRSDDLVILGLFFKVILVIFGMPVYAGRIPETVTTFLEKLSGNDTPAVIIALYGNRAFDDALLEMKNISLETGFIPFAAGAFIGEHSFATDDVPLALGRPDEKDIEEARGFGEKIAGLKKTENTHSLKPAEVPGNIPYRERHPFPPVDIITDSEICTRCGTCVTVCPTAAVSDDDYSHDTEKCIVCAACIKSCPENARSFQGEFMEALSAKLAKLCDERKEPEFFF